MSENNDGGLAERGGTSNVSGTGANYGGSGGPTGSGGSNSGNVGQNYGTVGNNNQGQNFSSYNTPSRNLTTAPRERYYTVFDQAPTIDNSVPTDPYGRHEITESGFDNYVEEGGWQDLGSAADWDAQGRPGLTNAGSLAQNRARASNPSGAAGANSGQGGMGAGYWAVGGTQRPPTPASNGFGGRNTGQGGSGSESPGGPGGLQHHGGWATGSIGTASRGIGPDNPMSPGFAERQAAARLNKAEKKAAPPPRPAPRPVVARPAPPRPVNPALSGGRGGQTPANIAGSGQIRRFARGGHLPGYADGGYDGGLGLVGEREGTADMELIDAPGGASITPVMDDDGGDDAIRDSAVRHITKMLFGGKKGGHTGGPPQRREPRGGEGSRGDSMARTAHNQSRELNNSNTGFGGNNGGGGDGPPANNGTHQPRGFGTDIDPGNTEGPPPGNPRAFFGGVHKVQPPQAGYAFMRPRAMGNPNGNGFRVPGISMNLGNYRPSGNQGQGGSGPDDDNASGLGVSGGPGPWG